jgi:Ca2+-binding EF-hand superfamily protein
MTRAPLDCFTDRQLAAFKREFERCDTDTDKLLSRDEFVDALRHVGLVPTPDDLRAMFQDLAVGADSDDGQATVDIFGFIQVLYYYVRGADKPEDLIRAFSVF